MSNQRFLDAVKKEIHVQRFSATIGLIQDKITELDIKNDQLTSKVTLLEERINQSTQVASENLSSNVVPEQAFREAEDRHRRRKYLIISGLSDNSSGSIQDRSESDEEMIKEIVYQIGVDPFIPENVRRIGRLGADKPRLLRFKCPDVETKIAMLRAAKNLKRTVTFERVYINQDLTLTQRRQNKELRTELKRRLERTLSSEVAKSCHFMTKIFIDVFIAFHAFQTLTQQCSVVEIKH